MKTIIRSIVMMLISLLLLSCSHTATKQESNANQSIPRDTFLTLLSAAFNNTCDEPKSPFACMVTSIDVCKKNLPLAVDHCINEIRPKLPEIIDSNYDDSAQEELFSTCISNKFTALAGTKNLNISQCK